MRTLVDVILSYKKIPKNADGVAYRIAYNQIMNDMRAMRAEIPPIVSELPEGATLQDKENRAMARALYQRGRREHYATHMRRVFALAETAKSMRPLPKQGEPQ